MKQLAFCLVVLCVTTPFGCSRTPSKEPVWSIAFSPDGKYLVAGAGFSRTNVNVPFQGGEVKIWNVSTWELDASFHDGFTGYVCSVTFSPDGSVLAAASDKHIRWGTSDRHDGNSIRFWTMNDKKELASINLEKRGAFVGQVAFSPNNDLLIVGRTGHPSVVLDRAKGTELYALASPNGYRASFAFSPDSKTIVAATRAIPSLRLFDSKTGNEKAAVDLGGKFALCNQFSPDGNVVAAGCDNGDIYIVDPALNKIKKVMKTKLNKIRSLTFSPNSKALAVASPDTALIIDVNDESILQTYPKQSESINSLAFSPDGTMLAIGGGWPLTNGRQTSALRVWNALTGELITTLE